MAKKKLTILVDMDDTIENLTQTWLGYLNERYGLNAEEKDVTSWKFDVAYPSLSKTQVYSVLREDALWQRVRPLPYAQSCMRKLHDDGHEIYIVTSSNYHTLKTKMEDVLFAYFPFIDWDHVIVASNKQMIRGDVMVDDAPHNLEGGSYAKILMTAPHNLRYDAVSHEMFRVHNWRQVYDLICTLANE